MTVERVCLLSSKLDDEASKSAQQRYFRTYMYHHSSTPCRTAQSARR